MVRRPPTGLLEFCRVSQVDSHGTALDEEPFMRTTWLKSAAVTLLTASAALAAGSASTGCNVEAPQNDSDIIGGVDAKSAKLDAIGTLGTKDYDGKFSMFCTGTLIAPKVVLTAKHCTAPGPGQTPMIANEEIFFAVGSDSSAPKQIIKAKSVFASPVDDGGMVKFGNDVAVYLLEAPVEGVEPLPYASAHLSADLVGKTFTAVGYGVQDRNRTIGTRKAGTLTLQAVDGQPIHKLFPTKEEYLSFFTKQEGESWVKYNQTRLDEFYDFKLLDGREAYLGMGKNDAQPCSGDSGGPLVQKVDGKLQVVAVVSGSFKGATYPCSTVGEAYGTFGPEAQKMIASVTGPCEGEPVEGRCDGDTVVRCVGDNEGAQKITRTDCAGLLQTCGVVDTKAVCVDAP